MNALIQKTKIVILGSGNVTTHLALALQQVGCEIVQVFGRNEKTVKELSQKLNNCATTTNLQEITKDAELYILALSDEGVVSVAKELRLQNKIVVHCAGSLPMNILQEVSSNYGVFYPLYTFSKNIPLNFREIPICVEASNEETGIRLMEIAQNISSKIEWVDTEKRKNIHLSAVFVSNFTNLINTAAYEIMSANGLDFALLMPLMQETLRKTEKGNPFQYQTGPAIRNDQEVIQMQLELLEKYPLYKKLYEELTQAIQERALKS